MRQNNGPENLLYSLSVLRPGEAKRQFRRSIFEDYLLRGPLGQSACAYCGKWHEKLTLDHVVPKSKGGPHFAKFNLVPSCLRCNASKSNLPLFEWWRPQEFWTDRREDLLTSWVQSHSFVSAYTEVGSWEQWMEEIQHIVPIHKEKEQAVRWSPSLNLGMAS